MPRSCQRLHIHRDFFDTNSSSIAAQTRTKISTTVKNVIFRLCNAFAARPQPARSRDSLGSCPEKGTGNRHWCVFSKHDMQTVDPSTNSQLFTYRLQHCHCRRHTKPAALCAPTHCKTNLDQHFHRQGVYGSWTQTTHLCIQEPQFLARRSGVRYP